MDQSWVYECSFLNLLLYPGWRCNKGPCKYPVHSSPCWYMYEAGYYWLVHFYFLGPCKISGFIKVYSILITKSLHDWHNHYMPPSDVLHITHVGWFSQDYFSGLTLLLKQKLATILSILCKQVFASECMDCAHVLHLETAECGYTTMQTFLWRFKSH